MAQRTHKTQRAAHQPSGEEPLFIRLRAALAGSIRGGELREGEVLLEGAIASFIGSSRAPVRQALALLAKEKLVRRFDGRGYLVGKTSIPVRSQVSFPDLGWNLAELQTSEPAASTLYQTVERDLVHRSIIGEFRVVEAMLADHFGVSRTVAHEVMLRLEAIGIVQKDTSSRWSIVALDEKRIKDLYEIRQALEPIALVSAIEALPRSDFAAALERHREAARAYPSIAPEALDALETLLHVELVSGTTNYELVAALRRTRAILISGKHLLGTSIGYPAGEPFIGEHIGILECALRGDAKRAARQLREHLTSSAIKVTRRLAEFRDIYTPSPLSYVSKVKAS